MRDYVSAVCQRTGIDTPFSQELNSIGPGPSSKQTIQAMRGRTGATSKAPFQLLAGLSGISAH